MRKLLALTLAGAALASTGCGGANVVPAEGLSFKEKQAAIRFGDALKGRTSEGAITAECNNDGDGTFTCFASWDGGTARGSVVGDKPHVR